MLKPAVASLLACLLLFQGALAAPASPMQLANENRDACETCTFIVNVIHNLWGSDTMEDCFADLVIYICDSLHIEDHFVCTNIIGDFKDEVVWVLGQILIEPTELCGLFVPNCGHFVDPLAATWNLTIPGGKPPYKPKPDFDFKAPRLKVLHLSDLHIDRKYAPGQETLCAEPQCCRVANDTDEIRGRRDAPVKLPAGKWGMVGNCDSPYPLFKAMMDHIAATHKDIAYVVVSGDLESHADWDYTRERHQQMVRNTSDTIRNAMPRDVPVFFAVGNHEGVPINSFAPTFTPERFHMDWLYGTMADAWKGWVPGDQMQTVWFNGCYMRKLYPGLRIISVNNGLGDKINFFLYVNQTDPDGTMTWISNQLLDAEKAGDKVHFVAHIPGGAGEALESWAVNFYRLVNRFENTISAQFFGHTHSEEYNVYYENELDASSRATGVSWSAPSLTPYSEYQPAYRIYEIEGNYSGSQFRVVDWAEWYVDLNEANKKPDQDPEWKVLYPSVLDEYGLNDASPAEWARLIDRMVGDDKIFQKYRHNFYRRDPGTPCDEECKLGFLCSARQNHHNDALCKGLLNGVKSSPHKSSRRTPLPKVDRVPTSVEEVVARAKYLQNKRIFKSNRAEDKCKF